MKKRLQITVLQAVKKQKHKFNNLSRFWCLYKKKKRSLPILNKNKYNVYKSFNKL